MRVIFERREVDVALSRLAGATKTSVWECIRSTARYALRRVIAITPPASAKQGAEAISRDINKAVTPLSTEYFDRFYTQGKGSLASRMKELVRKNDKKTVEHILKTATKGAGPLTGRSLADFQPSQHTSQRNARGRVKNGRFATLQANQQESYRKQMQRLAGWTKGGWNAAAKYLQLPVATWVSRHGTAKSAVEADQASGVLTLVNARVKIPGYEAVVNTAMRATEGYLRGQMNKALQDAAKKAGF